MQVYACRDDRRTNLTDRCGGAGEAQDVDVDVDVRLMEYEYVGFMYLPSLHY